MNSKYLGKKNNLNLQKITTIKNTKIQTTFYLVIFFGYTCFLKKFYDHNHYYIFVVTHIFLYGCSLKQLVVLYK